jgi:hypothetical protein
MKAVHLKGWTDRRISLPATKIPPLVPGRRLRKGIIRGCFGQHSRNSADVLLFNRDVRFTPKADINETHCHVRFVPKGDIASVARHNESVLADGSKRHIFTDILGSIAADQFNPPVPGIVRYAPLATKMMRCRERSDGP